jgi:hypothetical protein
VTTDKDENQNTSVPRTDPQGTLYGDVKEYHVVNTVVTKNRQFCCRDCQIWKVEMRNKKHGRPAVLVMLHCIQENVSPTTIPKRSICTNIPCSRAHLKFQQNPL